MDLLATHCHAAPARKVLRALSLALLALLWLATTLSDVSEGAEASLEYSVKGAYLFKFSSFVEWPPAVLPAPGAPVIIGVLGDDPFGPILDRMAAEQTAGDRPFVVQRTHRVDQARGAHILFISQSEEARMDLIRTNLRDSSVLTVADFNQPGVIITFQMENNKVRFAVNLDQAQRAGLKLSSRLLGVATAVHKD